MTTVQEPVDNWITGSDKVHTTAGTIASGEVLPARAPLGQVTATGKLVEWAPGASDGSEIAVYLTSSAVDASGGDLAAQVIKSGTFNPEDVAWPAGATAAQKLCAFVGTPISLQTPY